MKRPASKRDLVFILLPLLMSEVFSSQLSPFSCEVAAADITRDIKLKTRIDGATIYRAGNVEVIRRGEVSLEPGICRLVCEDLPMRFDESTLIVSARGLEEAKIIGVDLKSREEAVSKPSEYESLLKKRDSLNLRKDYLLIRRRSYQKRLSFLSSLGDFSVESAQDELAREAFSLEEWRTLVDFIQAENVTAEESIAKVNRELKDIDKALEWITKEIRKMRVEEEGKVAVIDCESSKPGRIAVTISYLVPGASWKPEYTVRYHEAESTISLDYNAILSQTTGENWKDVLVVLSTAKPHLGASAPDLNPYYLRYNPPRIPPVVSARAKEDTKVLEEEILGGRGAAVSREVTETISSEHSVNFRIKRPVSLSTGLEERRVLIQSFELPVAKAPYCAPRLSKNAYTIGTLRNTAETPLLRGKAGVYVETPSPLRGKPVSTFIGNEIIPAVAAGQEFKIDLGIDQEIKAEHKLVRREYLSKTGDKRKEIRYHYLMKVQNFKERKIEIILEDRLPVSTMDDIDVDDIDIDPDPYELKENGIITWKIPLSPEEKMEVSMKYTIKFPGNWSERDINLE